MKVLARLLVVVVVAALLLTPLSVLADQIPMPLQKKIAPGVTTVNYAGQNLRFTTPIGLVVKFDPITETRIRLTVRAYGSASATQGGQVAVISIYWENWGSDVYTGSAPTASNPWEGVLNSESGFTEK